VEELYVDVVDARVEAFTEGHLLLDVGPEVLRDLDVASLHDDVQGDLLCAVSPL
jgi:hypothetical protein